MDAHAFNGGGSREGPRRDPGSGSKPRTSSRRATSRHRGTRTGGLPRERVLAIGGPGDFSNDDVARLYARIAGIPERITHVPRTVLSAIGWLVRPLHPGIARAMRLSSLPDDAFAETFDAASSGVERAIGPTTLEAFVRDRVRERVVRYRSADATAAVTA
jgi:hypothetical protein